jgi:hypothetical protein
LEASTGERLRGALVELGTTWIKFGQMLSLRPDVGEDVASEPGLLQASERPVHGPPDSAWSGWVGGDSPVSWQARPGSGRPLAG